MRHQYTPVFRDFLTSSMWAADPATRCVWLWFMLTADPEGYAVGTIPGVARQVGITLDEAIAAVKLLESPDPYSSTPGFEGRRIVKVERGWHLVNFVAHRERAKQETEKARKRAWISKHRAEQKQLTLPHVALNPAPMEIAFTQPVEPVENVGINVATYPLSVLDELEVESPDSNDLDTNVDASSETIDAPKPKPKPTPKPKEEKGSAPLPPRLLFDAPTVPTVHHTLEGWELSRELRDDALAQGLTEVQVATRLIELRNGPIGGVRGVLDRDAYVRAQFPKWRTWAEADRMKAQRDAQAPSSRRFGAPDSAPPPPQRKRVVGLPEWVDAEHEALADKYGLNLKRAAMAFAKQAHIPPKNMRPIDVLAPFMKFLENLGRETAA
jgi:hypothetical protein